MRAHYAQHIRPIGQLLRHPRQLLVLYSRHIDGRDDDDVAGGMLQRRQDAPQRSDSGDWIGDNEIESIGRWRTVRVRRENQHGASSPRELLRQIAEYRMSLDLKRCFWPAHA